MVQLDGRLEQLTNAVMGLRTDMEPVSRVCLQRLSATIAASEAPEDKLQDVRRALDCHVLTITASEPVELMETEALDSMDPYIDALLQAPHCKDEYAFGWWVGCQSCATLWCKHVVVVLWAKAAVVLFLMNCYCCITTCMRQFDSLL